MRFGVRSPAVHLVHPRSLRLLTLLGALSSCASSAPVRPAEPGASREETAGDETSAALPDLEVLAFLYAPEPPDGTFLVDAATGRVALRVSLEDGGRGNPNEHVFVVAVGEDGVVSHHVIRDADEMEGESPEIEREVAIRQVVVAGELAGFVVSTFERAIVESDGAGRLEVYAQPDGDEERGALLQVIEPTPPARAFLWCARDDEGFEMRAPDAPALDAQVYYSRAVGLLVVQPSYSWSDLCTDREPATYVVRLDP